MSSRGIFGCATWVLSFAALGGLPACSDDGAAFNESPATSGSGGAGGAAATGGTSSTGGTSTGGTGGRAGSVSTSGGTGGSGGTGAAGLGGGSGSGGKGGPMTGAAGRPLAGGGGAGGSPSGDAGAPGPRGGGTGDSPYEIECHGDTVMCGDPTTLLCLGLRVETEVFGYSCSNECQSDADCSDLPASAEAAAGCVNFVNKKYCLLVCKNGDEQASCPSGMYCYAYEGAPVGYCLWH